jgi:predicted GTPase
MNIFTQKSELEGILTELVLLPDDVFSLDKKNAVKTFQNNLQEQRFPVVFAGRFSTGKSLLLNRLFLEEDLLPSKIQPTTARTMFIQYGQEKSFYLLKREDDTEVTKTKVAATEENIRKYCTHMGERKDEYERFVLEYPLEVLKNGVMFVDTVGTDDIDDKYVSQTINRIEEAAVVVYVTNALQPLAQSEIEFLRQHLSETPKRLFLVANKIDGRSDPSEQKTIADDLSERFRNFYEQEGIRSEDKVFLVSAKTGKGLEEFRERIIDFIANGRVKELITQTSFETKSVLDEEISEIDNILNQLSLQQQGEEEKLVKQKEELLELQETLNTKEIEYESLKDELLIYSEQKIETLIQNSEDRVNNRVAGYEIEVDELAILIEREIQKTMYISNKKVQLKFMELFKERLNKKIADFSISEKAFSKMKMKERAEKVGTRVAATAGLGGVASILGGISSAIPAATVATFQGAGAITFFEIPLWGASASLGTTFSLSAAFSAGAPLIIPGVIALLSASFIYKTLQNKKKGTSNISISQVFQEARISINNELQESLENMIQSIINKMIEKLSEQIKSLEKILGETQPEKIEHEISEYKIKKEKLICYIEKMEKFL